MLMEVDPIKLLSDKNSYPGEHNLLISWLEENVGQRLHEFCNPYEGLGWACWITYDPKTFEVNYCEIEFTDKIEEHIISMFILRWK